MIPPLFPPVVKRASVESRDGTKYTIDVIVVKKGSKEVKKLRIVPETASNYSDAIAFAKFIKKEAMNDARKAIREAAREVREEERTQNH